MATFQEAEAGSASGATSWTYNFATITPVSGETVVALITHANDFTTTVSGYTVIDTTPIGAGSNNNNVFCYKVLTGSDTSIGGTCSGASGSFIVGLAVFSGSETFEEFAEDNTYLTSTFPSGSKSVGHGTLNPGGDGIAFAAMTVPDRRNWSGGAATFSNMTQASLYSSGSSPWNEIAYKTYTGTSAIAETASSTDAGTDYAWGIGAIFSTITGGGGLGIPIAAYHYNHNTGSRL